MDAVKAFSEVLRGVRKEREMSQEELADACRLDRTYISLLERADRQPTLTTLLLLAAALGTTASAFLVEVEKRLGSGGSSAKPAARGRPKSRGK